MLYKTLKENCISKSFLLSDGLAFSPSIAFLHDLINFWISSDENIISGSGL
ncbi:hypothetical protein GLIP_1498 [Aliiglaciecola lipolytica E3]|uniref:Uncharacterized protein n=1 Tax=Aliiglaciecola lipolytica E3 TaxID=1127673 RepID=K6Y7D2_9ALTE|nr:hypothetical protein GLIP_1498 [Aliiglaciecola lipolytica E3]